MEPFDENTDMPQELKAMVERLKLRNELSKNVDARLDSQADKVEREVLMRTWADVGNSRFDYWLNMKAIATFRKCISGMRKVNKLPLEMAILIQSALIEVAKHDLGALTAIQEEREKLGIHE